MVVVVVVGMLTMVLVFMVVMVVMRRKTFTGVSFASSPDFWPCQILDTLNRHDKKKNSIQKKMYSIFLIEKYLFFAASIGAKEPIKGNMHRSVVAVEVLEYEVNIMMKKKKNTKK